MDTKLFLAIAAACALGAACGDETTDAPATDSGTPSYVDSAVSSSDATVLGSDASAPKSIMCGASTCLGQSLGGFMLAPCCKPTTNECAYDATLINRGCVTLAEFTSGAGDAGVGPTDAATPVTDGGSSVDSGSPVASGACQAIVGMFATQSGGLAMKCCTSDNKCGVSILGSACDPSVLSSFLDGGTLPCP